MYRLFRAAWQMATRPYSTFPPPSLKFRTVGFPQYGFKREVHGDLRRVVPARTYTPCKCDPRTLMAITGMLSGPSVTAPPAQRPLARQRVMLCRQVSAYYGLIRDSGRLPPTYFIRRVSVAQLLPTGRPEVPQFTLRVCTHVPHSVPRWIVRLLMAVTSPHILAFAIFVLARHPLTHKIRVTVACVTRLQVSLYATARRVCLPCPGQDFYFRAFIFEDRSPKRSSITTWAYSQFP